MAEFKDGSNYKRLEMEADQECTEWAIRNAKEPKQH